MAAWMDGIDCKQWFVVQRGISLVEPFESETVPFESADVGAAAAVASLWLAKMLQTELSEFTVNHEFQSSSFIALLFTDSDGCRER